VNFRVKQWIVAALSLFFLGSLITVGFIESGRLLPEKKAKVVVTAKNEGCVNCHAEKSPGIVSQWKDSRHAPLGVGCVDCHQAKKEDPDAWEHEGSLVATVVSPKDCARCHAKVAKEFTNSHHAKAAQFIGSLDNFLGVVVEGAPAAIGGCQKCHGSTVKVLKSGKLDPSTWPNSGVGRINPDGSNGTCSACHARHTFSAAQARQPENCGKCHMGPDHPQIEIYNESKHGIVFRARIKEMNLDSRSWVVGKDYTAAPTCATCHMSATKDLPITHDVGKRISWTLRPVVSKKLKNWEAKRKDMQNVCAACHGPDFTKSFYTQYDNIIGLYNEKFAVPARDIMLALKKEGKITSTPFDDKIEWTFFELWHHEGRRARMGASMQGPDYTQWHGFYEVAKHFYFKFIPEAEKLSPGLTERFVKGKHHQWRKGMTKAQIQQMLDFYQKRYGAEEKK
jgi:hypothetical protein